MLESLVFTCGVHTACCALSDMYTFVLMHTQRRTHTHLHAGYFGQNIANHVSRFLTMDLKITAGHNQSYQEFIL